MKLQFSLVRLFTLAVAAYSSLATSSHAIVSFTGDMAPADSPFTSVNEGINGDGNFVRTTLLVTDPEAWRFYETPANIRVGSTGRGQLSLNGGSNLRYHSLMIGGGGTSFLPYPGYPGAQGASNGEPIPDAEIVTRSLLDSEPVAGYGTVRVEGFGTVFNNDPLLVPEIFVVALAVAGTPSTDANPTPDVTPRDLADGQDVYVGYTGRGELLVNTGGSVEIQDGLFVGSGPRSNGLVIVDGLSSSLLVNGLQSGRRTNNTPGIRGELPSVVGGYGTGVLRIINGASADLGNGLGIGTWAASGINADSPGAAVGGNRITEFAIQSGQVYVAGVGSRLTINGREEGGLAIGEYQPDHEMAYDLDYGRGGLTIGPGATVSVTADTQDDADDVVIGRFGELAIPGGRLSVLDELTNDGIIKTSGIGEIAVGVQGTIHGAGRIDVGTFFNRREGEIRIGAGESLKVVSYGDGDHTGVTPALRMGNVGLIDVTGGELEFDRVRTADVDRFQNFSFSVPGAGPMDPPSVSRGQIVSRDATLRFRSGIANSGDLDFVGGSNLVTGIVDNLAEGVILVGGNGTSVSFTDNVVNAGIIDISPESSIVHFLQDLDNTGSLQITLGGRQSGNGHIAVGDDLTLAGTLDVRIFDPAVTGTNPLQPQAGDAFEIMSAAGDLTGMFAIQQLPTLPAGIDWTIDYNTTLDTVTLRVLSLAGVMGGDFNGDGIVDAADLAIWQQFFGITMGATRLQGDADGDGDVDGDDLIIIIDQLGGPGMSLIAATPSSSVNSTAVPEPASLALACGGLLALLALRRRQ